MDRYVRNFIAASIFYLAVASLMGIAMLIYPDTSGVLRFPHSHLMLIGWVTMMIYGVGYHILPRFAGKLLKNQKIGELHFWLANIGLLGMVIAQPLYLYHPDEKGLVVVLGVSGLLQVVSSGLFFYNMYTIFFSKEQTGPDVNRQT
jgi:cbb3-type cytochrome oxidase subunit 1